MTERPEGRPGEERELLRAAMRFNTLVFASILGFITGLVLALLALLNVGRHGDAALAVALLGVFLPGYASSWLGALAGLLWGVLLGGLLGSGIYRIHGRTVLHESRLPVLLERPSDELPTAFVRLDGGALGLGVGLVGAAGLVVTTNVLVARGTAAQSVHARLLAEIFPGYDVSVAGSVVGGVELFVALYALSRLFAWIYNAIATARHPQP